ncbi:MAG: ROK family protein [Alicyclobacillaceae bacterium]|nr:ROK family protein [Alicyclobacillaceae bacterium]
MGKLNPVVLGIDVGGTNIKAGLVGPSGELVAKEAWPTEGRLGPREVIRRLAVRVKAMAERAGVSWERVQGAGSGWPAFLDLPSGVIEEAINLGWKDVPVAAWLEEVLQKPVAVDNDANAAALGEAWIGAGQGAGSVLCVTLGTGVGGGIVFNGALYRGASAMAGEIGHLPLKPEGEPCTCGRRGCLETLASATAVVREARRRGVASPPGGPAALTARDVFALAAQGHPVAKEVVEEAASWLGLGLAAAANLLNPEVIVVGGGMAEAGDLLFVPLEAEFRRRALPRVARFCRLTPALLGGSAGVFGAARLAWQRVGR